MGRNYLAHQPGDAINAILAAAGYNFRLLLNWLRLLLRVLLVLLTGRLRPLQLRKPIVHGGFNCPLSQNK